MPQSGHRRANKKRRPGKVTIASALNGGIGPQAFDGEIDEAAQLGGGTPAFLVDDVNGQRFWLEVAEHDPQGTFHDVRRGLVG